jgi:cytochrome c
MSSTRTRVLALLLSTAASGPVWADGDAGHGKTLFSARCSACHAVTAQIKIGPGLAGVVGRKAGTAPNFHYSQAMVAYGKVWDDQTLDTLLAGPSKAIPGTRMVVAVPGASDRADIIAYLKTLGAP